MWPINCLVAGFKGWGKGSTRQRLKEEKAAQNKWLRKNVRYCPRCKTAIWKDEGCDHVTCPGKCAFNFCWICLKPWRLDSHSHDCKYHISAELRKQYEEQEPESDGEFMEENGVYIDRRQGVVSLYDSTLAGKIKHVLSYFKVNFRKAASKIDLLLALHTFAPTVSAREQQAIVTWLQAQNITLGGLARAITEAREPTQTTEGSKVVVTTPEVDTKALKLDPDGNECPVCCNKLTTDSFPQQQLTSTCDHKPTFCFACLRRCVNDHIREDPWRPLQCPECKEKMEEDDVKRVVSAERFEKYKRNLEISVIRDLPNFIMCLNPTCDSGQLHKSGATQPVMTCEACSFQTCFNHNLPWHDDLTCDEFDQLHKERLKGEEASEEYLLDNTKICPGPGCGIHTIKEGRACDHITCTACNFDYCWICLVTYDMVRAIGGTAHARTCHLWKEETPTEQKARKAEIRRVSDARRAEKSLKRKIGEVEDADEGVEE